MLLEGPPNGVSLKEFVSSPVNYSLSLYCSNGDVINGTNEGYCTEDGTWKPQVGRCPPENCKLSDLKEKRFFLAAKLTESDVNNTGIAAHGKTAKAVCCGHKYPDDSNQWPYTFTCQDGTWFPKTECNEDQYAFCNVKDLVEKKFFIAAERVGTGIKDTTYQTHGNNATAVCCGNKYPKDPNKWPYKFICQHGKWLPDIECNDEIDE
ncbi:unnamed protein product [Heligmosomoides polygyrus]|uniref:Sushi domain-containing protein n=1 Tax=Heligmosomoides polygyrus TaxID=6339 RepID=A0A183F730_HELPZ|nr:unnamed protein product [Heligmosomoides polygyrus]